MRSGLCHRIREISFQLPEQIPSISDYFNTVNMTVDELHTMLLDVDLAAKADLLWEQAQALASHIDMSICDAVSRISSAKLRTDVFKGCVIIGTDIAHCNDTRSLCNSLTQTGFNIKTFCMCVFQSLTLPC